MSSTSSKWVPFRCLSMETGKNHTGQGLASKEDVWAIQVVCSPKTFKQSVPCVQVHCWCTGSMTLRIKVSAVFAWLFHRGFWALSSSRPDWHSAQEEQSHMDNSPDIRKSDEQCLHFGLWLAKFLWTWRICSLPLCALTLHLCVVLATSDSTVQKVILSLQKVVANF